MQNETQKIAELLFPNVTQTREEIEKKYPERNLPQGAMVTRFAPSPTGYLHLGHFFGALIDYEIAKSTNGIFYFRLEDTDQKREIKDAQNVALKTLKTFGITHDEGLMLGGTEVGNYGPYVQSKRVEIYKVYAKDLVAKGRAFPCFCEKTTGKEDVLQRREEQLEEFNDLVDHDPCRNLSFEQVKQNLQQGKTFAIKLYSTGEPNVKIETNDLLLGKRFVNSNCKDVVILKSDFIPPYAFAHVIDDHLMKTTLVVRGAEWYSSIASHLDIFKALDFEPIPYCHTPLLCKLAENGNKRKLSKRYDPEADMRYYVQQGYPKESVIEYLLTLINSNFEEWRLANPNADVSEFEFRLDKITATYPLVDLVKFNDISKNVISKFSSEKVYNEILAWAKEFNVEFAKLLEEYKDYSIAIFNIGREDIKPRKDLVKWEDAPRLYSYFFKQLFEPTSLKQYEMDENFKIEDIKNIFDAYFDTYNEQDDKQVWFNKIKELSGFVGYASDMKEYKKNPSNYKGNYGHICTDIRVVLTGRKDTPELYDICRLLGIKEMKRRVLLFLSLVK